jgi:hypothetical protein
MSCLSPKETGLFPPLFLHSAHIHLSGS